MEKQAKLRQTADSFLNFCSRKVSRTTLIIVLVLYIAVTTVTACFHEPWHDEAQAWQIARVVPLKDIIFKIPHTEGHPPLWHLILVPFAKGGLPYEASLKFVNILFSSLAAAVILFKTRLPDMLKVTLPFTYYIFYQYGVISRPYSMMMLAMMLCGVYYRDKNKKPVPYMLSILFLCLTSAYGMAIACGLCIEWIIGFFLKYGSIKKMIGEMVKSGVLVSLAIILVSAVLILLMIRPSNQTDGFLTSTDIYSILYGVFGLIYDATVGMLITSDITLRVLFVVVSVWDIVQMIPIAIAVWAVIIIYGRKKKKLLAFLIPFTLLDISFIFIRMGMQHIGIAALLLFAWICMENPDVPADDADAAAGADGSSSAGETAAFDKEFILRLIFAAGAAILMFTQIYWSVTSMIMEIGHNYASSRDVAAFIKDNGLTNADNLMCMNIVREFEDGSEIVVLDSYALGAVEVFPYLDENCFYNFRCGRNDQTYCENIIKYKYNDYTQELEYIISRGIPNYIFGLSYVTDKNAYIQSNENKVRKNSKTFSYVYDDHYYTIVASFETCKIFKGNGVTTYFPIFKRIDDWKEEVYGE